MKSHLFCNRFSIFLLVIFTIIRGQILRLKKSKHCSVKNPSNERSSSLFITTYINSIKYQISMVECYTQCYNEQDCDYFAYNEPARICLFVKGTVGNLLNQCKRVSTRINYFGVTLKALIVLVNIIVIKGSSLK